MLAKRVDVDGDRCADTKLIPSFRVGSRDAYDANVFMRDLAGGGWPIASN